MRPLAFIGFGTLARQMREFLVSDPAISDDVVFDDNAYRSGLPFAYPFDDCQRNDFSNHAFYVCLGYKHLSVKSSLIASLLSLGRHLPVFIHPTAFISKHATVGAGAIIYPMCNVDAHANIEPGVLLNNSVVISHNSNIGACCFLSPGVVIAGDVRLGASTFIGAGTVITNGVSISDNVVIGIGSVVTRDIQTPGESWIGNPLRRLSHTLSLR